MSVIACNMARTRLWVRRSPLTPAGPLRSPCLQALAPVRHSVTSWLS